MVTCISGLRMSAAAFFAFVTFPCTIFNERMSCESAVWFDAGWSKMSPNSTSCGRILLFRVLSNIWVWFRTDEIMLSTFRPDCKTSSNPLCRSSSSSWLRNEKANNHTHFTNTNIVLNIHVKEQINTISIEACLLNVTNSANNASAMVICVCTNSFYSGVSMMVLYVVQRQWVFVWKNKEVFIKLKIHRIALD